MSKYGYTSLDVPTECVEQPRETKKRLQKAKLKLREFINLTEFMDIPYDNRNQAIGCAYMEVYRLERQMANIKKARHGRRKK